MYNICLYSTHLDIDASGGISSITHRLPQAVSGQKTVVKGIKPSHVPELGPEVTSPASSPKRREGKCLMKVNGKPMVYSCARHYGIFNVNSEHWHIWHPALHYIQVMGGDLWEKGNMALKGSSHLALLNVNHGFILPTLHLFFQLYVLSAPYLHPRQLHYSSSACMMSLFSSACC